MSQPQFLEAYYIKIQAREINFGLKTSKELQLFKIIPIITST